jgi:glycosyltransferase involved in cell wall biosynthesis
LKRRAGFAVTSLLLNVFPSFDPGGAQTRFVTLANHFGAKLRHVIIALDGRTGCTQSLAPEVEFRCLPVAARKNTLTGNLGRFRRILRDVRPDILVTHNWGTIEWSAAKIATGCRHIHIEDGFGPEEAHGQYRRRVLARRLLLRHSTVVVPSRNLERLARQTWHIPRANLRYIPNGIDLERFARTEEAENPTPVIGTVAALRPEKNLTRLIRAFAQVAATTPCRLVIVGAGPERDALEATTHALGVAKDVDFAGHQPDPSRFYKQFDVFAITSDTEQMPYTVLEAMAAGCSVVATDVGDIRQMVSPANQPFVVGQDDQAVCEALKSLLCDQALRKRVGAANLQIARLKYGRDIMFRSFAEMYNVPGLIAD